MRLRIFAAALLCGVFCAGALAGCARLGQSAAASRQPGGAAEANMGQGTALDDGQLRVLPGSANSTPTVFCGAEVLYTAPAHGMAYLLADDTTKKAEYYVAAAPEGATQYVRRIYDASGQEVYTCAPNEYPETLCGGWLLTVRCGGTASAEDSAVSPAALCTDCRLVQLATGEIRSVPDGASSFFSVMPDVYCLAGWGTADTPGASFTILYDAHLRELKRFEGYAVMLPYTSGVPFAAQWLQLVCGADESNLLYNVTTGQTISGFSVACGSHYATLSPQNGCYTVIDTDSGEAVFSDAARCELYLGGSGSALVYDSPANPDYSSLRRADGSYAALLSYSVCSDGGLAALLPGALEVYDAQGTLLYTLQNSRFAADGYCYVTALAGGECLLSAPAQENGAPSGFALCNANGLFWENAGYDSVTPTFGGQYFSFGRSPTASSCVYDLRDLQGKLLISGLADYSDISDPAVFFARKGDQEGWMDFSGSWLWSRSVWQLPAEEAGRS